MNKQISEKEYLLSLISEDEYNVWQKLMRSMTTSARMMGLKDNPFTRQVFNTALTKLTDFEQEHNIQFYELGVSMANAEAIIQN